MVVAGFGFEMVEQYSDSGLDLKDDWEVVPPPVSVVKAEHPVKSRANPASAMLFLPELNLFLVEC